MENTTSYWLEYGLQCDPFAVTGPSSYFLVPQWQQEIELLQHMVQFSNVMIIITGKAGVGKTVFKNQFMQKIKTTVEIVSIDAKIDLAPATIKKTIAHRLRLPLLESLEAQIEYLQQENRCALLIIDDAHQLTQETLNALLQLVKLQYESEQPTALHVLLIGGIALNEEIDALKHSFIVDGKQLIHHNELEPLNLQQMVQYLEFRLNTAGFTDILPFHELDLDDIYRRSKGFFLEINEYAAAILQEKLYLQAAVKNTAHRAKSYAYISVILLIAALLVTAGIVALNNGGAKDDSVLFTPAEPDKLDNFQETFDEAELEPEAGIEQFDTKSVATDIDLLPEQTVNQAKPAYGLQILGTSSREALDEFIIQHQLEHKTVAYKGTRNKQTWYSLVYGQYNSKEEARAIIGQLPEDIQRLQPWPRAFEELATAEQIKR